MLLITDLDEIPELHAPCGLTIGNFDGVHLGHQALISYLRSQLPSGHQVAVFTFSNHPSHLLAGGEPVPLIYPAGQKVRYLQALGVDIVLSIPFTPLFSQIPFDQFLRLLKQRLHLSHLVLGKGARFGRKQEGDEVRVKELASILDIQAEYLTKFFIGDVAVSSGRIRSLIMEGNLAAASACLGRPYSLVGVMQHHAMPTPYLCLPPPGTYPVNVKVAGELLLGEAEIRPSEQRLHLHLQDALQKIDGQQVEVFF